MMRKVVLTFFLFLLMCSVSYAECNPLEYSIESYDLLIDALGVYFPFSVLTSVTSWAIGVSEMSALSPAGYEITIFGNTFYPLAFMGSEIADYFFVALRWLFLVLVVVQFASHVLSRIL